MLLEKPGIKLSAGLFDILSSYYRIIGAVSGKKLSTVLKLFYYTSLNIPWLHRIYIKRAFEYAQ